MIGFQCNFVDKKQVIDPVILYVLIIVLVY